MAAVDELSNKQRAFIEYYIGEAGWNATKAARLAGYSEETAKEIGYENLTKPHIRQAVSERLAEIAMGANEVLARLGDQARSSMAYFVNERGRLDLQAGLESGKFHLVKKLSQAEKGDSVELYDAQAALVHIGRHHGLFKDVSQVQGPGGKAVQVEYVKDWRGGSDSDEE